MIRIIGFVTVSLLICQLSYADTNADTRIKELERKVDNLQKQLVLAVDMISIANKGAADDSDQLENVFDRCVDLNDNMLKMMKTFHPEIK